MLNKFTELGLGDDLVRSLEKKGYTEPTPIQEMAIPQVLNGTDLLATAQTGTGKTAGFALPILQLLSEQNERQREIRALILTPTRELAEQIDRNIQVYSRNLRITSTVLVGGASMGAQKNRLRQRPTIVVATPGRLMDLMRQRALSLSKIQMLVLDEADRMLDMGFIKDVRSIVSDIPEARQTLLFSATMSPEIADLAKTILRSPERIAIAPAATVAENLDQSVYFVDQKKKVDLLTKKLEKLKGQRVLIFTRTKHRANRLAQQLCHADIAADAIHSNKSQGARRRTLADFDRGKVKVLVATDVVARGIDVKEISHVINFELPDDPENYVHRIGRTARAQQSGAAFTFCAAAEVGTLKAIEVLIKQKLIVDLDQPFHSQLTSEKYETARPSSGGARNRGRGGGGGSRGRGASSRGRGSSGRDRRSSGGRGRGASSDSRRSSSRDGASSNRRDRRDSFEGGRSRSSEGHRGSSQRRDRRDDDRGRSSYAGNRDSSDRSRGSSYAGGRGASSERGSSERSGRGSYGDRRRSSSDGHRGSSSRSGGRDSYESRGRSSSEGNRGSSQRGSSQRRDSRDGNSEGNRRSSSNYRGSSTSGGRGGRSFDGDRSSSHRGQRDSSRGSYGNSRNGNRDSGSSDRRGDSSGRDQGRSFTGDRDSYSGNRQGGSSSGRGRGGPSSDRNRGGSSGGRSRGPRSSQSSRANDQRSSRGGANTSGSGRGSSGRSNNRRRQQTAR